MSITEDLEKFINAELALRSSSEKISPRDDLLERGLIDSMGILRLSAYPRR